MSDLGSAMQVTVKVRPRKHHNQRLVGMHLLKSTNRLEALESVQSNQHITGASSILACDTCPMTECLEEANPAKSGHPISVQQGFR
jgi:hypothetical protein